LSVIGRINNQTLAGGCRNVILQNTYVDDSLIIFHQNKTDEEYITNCLNSNHENLEFKLTEEENYINHLDIDTITIYLGIHRKPTQTDTTIHFTSNHPLEHKIALHIFHTNRIIKLTITEQT
jgi:hypothetical protein